MSEHSLKELKRQLDDKRSKFNSARIDVEYAEKRLHDAMCRESGFMGTEVVGRKGERVLVHDVQFLVGQPWVLKGFAFKKDGKLGFAERHVYVSDLPPKPSSEPTP